MPSVLDAKFDLPRLTFLVFTALTVLVILFFGGYVLMEAMPTFLRQGLYFFIGSRWDYSQHMYGAFNYIVGTLSLLVITMAIAIPISLLTAIYLAEFASERFRSVARPLIELLVGIPSVVYGIFGFFMLEPYFKNLINPFIGGTLGFIPIFREITPGSGNGLLLASTVLAIMILPTIVVISEESMRSVPREYREASLALGSTRWEMITLVVVPAAISGIITAIILSMMRALGETMAIVMLMGNNAHIPDSILDNACAMTTKILGDAEAHLIVDEHRSALFAMAAVLFMIEAVLVGISRLIVRNKI